MLNAKFFEIFDVNAFSTTNTNALNTSIIVSGGLHNKQKAPVASWRFLPMSQPLC